MVGEISKIILETKFKQNHETKSKTLETHCYWKNAVYKKWRIKKSGKEK